MRTAAATVAGLLVMAAGAQAARATPGPRIASYQQTATLFGTHTVRSQPDGLAVGTVGPTRPITGQRTVLPVLAQSIGDRGRVWLRVRLPGRALGRRPPPKTGWIRAVNTQFLVTAWHIVVDLGARRVDVYRNGRRLRRYPAIVGKPVTPTPAGEYFVEENVRLGPYRPGGPFALATSDRSNVLQEFGGGPGQIAIHGRANLPGALGSAVSHGCLRLADGAITWLAARIDPGVPVTVTRDQTRARL